MPQALANSAINLGISCAVTDIDKEVGKPLEGLFESVMISS
jgi:hypothetical protein